MKKSLLILMVGMGISTLLAGQAQASRAIDDFRLSNSIRETLAEANPGEISGASPQEIREQEVQQIKELLRADELNRENTMREALRQENLSERVQGHADLEMAVEEQNVDMHLGKTLTDVHGNRVRMEEYVLRPEANQVQFVNLTMRDDRLDYINYNAYFNDILPRDTRGLWHKEFGKTAPSIYLVKETSKASNLTDAVEFQVNFFEPYWETASQQYVLPERDASLSINSTLKWGQTRTSPSVDFSAMPGAVGVTENYSVRTDGNYLAPRWHLTFTDGTFMEMQQYLITENGSVVTLRNLNDLVNLLKNLNEFVFRTYREQIWTASEFEGRTIDTVSQFQHLANTFGDQD
ncbi:MAG: hypothetical protein AB1439_04645 [candidate division FCPU426 bacterium]